MTVLLLTLFAGVAGGFDLFLAVASLSLLGQIGNIDLPGAAGDLGTVWLLGATGTLFAVEAYLDRRPRADLVWRLLGVVVRPTGAAGLAAILTNTPAGGGEVGAIVGAAGLALVVHALRSGRAFLGRLEVLKPEPGLSLALEDLYVLVMVVVLVTAPVGIMLLTLPLFAVLVMRGPGLLAGFLVSAALVWSAARGTLTPAGWRSPSGFPLWMKRQLAPTAIVTGGRLRASPVACLGYPQTGSLSRGWLVVRGREPRFVRPLRRHVDALSLLRGAETTVVRGPLWSSVLITTTDSRPVLLVVPVGGPNPDELLRELS